MVSFYVSLNVFTFFDSLGINNQKTQQKLETLEKNMRNQSGPLDCDFTTEDIISTIETLKLSKSNFWTVTNEVLKCN